MGGKSKETDLKVNVLSVGKKNLANERFFVKNR